MNTKAFIGRIRESLPAVEDLAVALVIVLPMLFPWLAILAVLVGADLPNV